MDVGGIGTIFRSTSPPESDERNVLQSGPPRSKGKCCSGIRLRRVCPDALLESSWALEKQFWSHVGPILYHFDISWVILGPTWNHIGANLGPSRGLDEKYWVMLGSYCVPLVSILDGSLRQLGRFRVKLGPCWACDSIVGHLGGRLWCLEVP